MITIHVQLKETSQPIIHDAENSYEKGSFYCIQMGNGKVAKYPIAHIWRITEDYGAHTLHPER